MEHHETKSFHYYLPQTDTSFDNLLSMSPSDPTCANLPQNPESTSSLFNRSSFPYNSPIFYFPPHTLSPNASPLSTESTLNEMNCHQLEIANERKLRRMISNRESAKRSRIRKKKQIEELESQVNHLRTMNHELSEKVIHLLECNQKILQENSQLKEKVSSLQLVLSEFLIPTRNAEDNTCSNANGFRGATSN